MKQKNLQIIKTPLKHLAIIMDGNGRWAQQRGLNRTKGHEKGAKLYAMSLLIVPNTLRLRVLLSMLLVQRTERQNFPVDFLMRLLDRYIQQGETYLNNNICFMTIGNTSTFYQNFKKRIEVTTETTKHNTSLMFIYLPSAMEGRAELSMQSTVLIKAKRKWSRDISSMLQTHV
ncbi:MAG: undecaprenyl diphosphate synthase family protein [Sulfurovum sp.]|nr:undecaprenyl diphosphate synthase family protein [Sulfurovum sp.]